MTNAMSFAAVALLLVTTSSGEPKFNDRTLTTWLTTYADATASIPPNQSAIEDAEAALEVIAEDQVLALNSQDPISREQAAITLQRLGQHAGKALLNAITNSSSVPDQYVVVRWISENGNNEQLLRSRAKFEPALLIILRSDSDIALRSAAFVALVDMSLLDGLTATFNPESLLDRVDLSRPDVKERYLKWLANNWSGDDKTADRLVESLNPKNEIGVRFEAAKQSGRITPQGESRNRLISALRQSLRNDSDPNVRQSAAYALGELRAFDAQTVAGLLRSAKPENEQVPIVRVYALQAIMRLAERDSSPPRARRIVSQLVEASDSSREPSSQVRLTAVQTLRVAHRWLSARDIETAVPVLVKSLHADANDPGTDVVSKQAKSTLELIVSPNRAIPLFTRALENEDSPTVRDTLGDLIASAAGKLIETRGNLSDAELAARIQELQLAIPIVTVNLPGTTHLDSVAKAESQLRMERATRILTAVVKVFQNNSEIRVASLVVAYFAITSVIWSVVARVKPLWLLRIDEVLTPLSIALPKVGTVLSARSLSLVSLFAYQTHVLDAWVTQYADAARQNFAKRRTVIDRTVHILGPAVLDDSTLAEFGPQQLATILRGSLRERCCILVFGEGGVGKTSLACAIGRWAMQNKPNLHVCDHLVLPILIDDEFETHTSNDQGPFAFEIGAQLRNLLSLGEAVPAELLNHLLRKRRVMVIVDHFSELTEEVQKCVRDELKRLPANIVILTSRDESTLDDATTHRISPLKVEGDRLSTFIEAYLRSRNVRDAFDDPEFFNLCRKLSTIVGRRKIPILLAKLYADEAIRSKTLPTDDDTPQSIPELILRYVAQINRETADRYSNPDVQRDMQIISWECLCTTFRPRDASKEDIIKRLRATSTAIDAKDRLEHLEQSLGIIETVGAREDRIRVPLDPIAEYLAAIYWVERDEDLLPFLSEIDEKSQPFGAHGFLLALWDCCVSSPGKRIDDEGLEKLGARARVSSGDIQRAMRRRCEQSVLECVQNLKSNDAELREISATELKELAAAHNDVVRQDLRQYSPQLIESLSDSAPGVREICAQLLGQVSPIAVEAIEELLRLSAEDSDQRVVDAANEAAGCIISVQLNEQLQEMTNQSHSRALRAKAANRAKEIVDSTGRYELLTQPESANCLHVGSVDEDPKVKQISNELLRRIGADIASPNP